MTQETYQYVFGPALSRRLGRSLGIDVLPFKTCTYDCIYCQLGRTTNRTVERKEYVPFEEVLSHWLPESVQPEEYMAAIRRTARDVKRGRGPSRAGVRAFLRRQRGKYGSREVEDHGFDR